MSDQECCPPMWLDDIFLKKMLEEKLRQDNIVIHRYNIEFATAIGQNLSSELFRLFVESSAGEFSLILKKRHESDKLHQINIPYQLYEKEIRFYEQYLPEIYTILKFIDEEEPLAPKVFYADIENEVMVLKDLQPEGFTVSNSETRVDRKSAEIFLRKLAKLHGASMIYNQTQKGRLEKHKMECYRIEGLFKNVYVNHMAAFLEEVKSWGEEFSEMIPKLEYISTNYLQLGDKMAKRKGISAIIHGDLWLSNFLFKKDPETKEPLDAIFIDFQLSCWASLSHDLINFFFTSLNEDDYQNHMTELVEVYYSHLERVLLKLNFKNLPTLDDLKLEIKENLFHGKFTFVISWFL